MWAGVEGKRLNARPPPLISAALNITTGRGQLHNSGRIHSRIDQKGKQTRADWPLRQKCHRRRTSRVHGGRHHIVLW